MPDPQTQASPPETSVAADFLFRQLVERLKGRSPEVSQRVVAHIREKTRHNTLPAFHTNGTSEGEKCDVYRECLAAVLKNDLSALRGSVPQGQSKTIKAEPKRTQAEPETLAQPKASNAPETDSRMAAVIAALSALTQPQAATIDAGQVREIVNAIVGERLKEVRAEALLKVNEYLAKVPPRETLEELERRIYGNAKWAEYVQKVRKYVAKNCGQSLYITPRATRKGAAYLAAGIPVEQVCDMVLFGLCSQEVRNTILLNVGEYQP